VVVVLEQMETKVLAALVVAVLVVKTLLLL
jgi:hypothetical protein